MKMLKKAVAMILTVTMVGTFAFVALAEENVEQPAAPVAAEPAREAAPVESQTKTAVVESPEVTPAPDATEAPQTEPAAPEETPSPEVTATPEETPSPEVTAAPEDTAAPEETTEATEEPIPTEEIAEEVPAGEEVAADLSNITVTIRCLNGSHAQVGDTITLVAEVSGADGVAYTMQWQYSNGGEWHDVGGANGSSYSYTLDEQNANDTWRMAISID